MPKHSKALKEFEDTVERYCYIDSDIPAHDVFLAAWYVIDNLREGLSKCIEKKEQEVSRSSSAVIRPR